VSIPPLPSIPRRIAAKIAIRLARRRARRHGIGSRERIAPANVWIVLVNWNGRDDTLACLESLARAELAGARIVVVDNGSHDGALDVIRQQYPAVDVCPLPRNEGFTGGCNAGLRHALGHGARAALLLNNDTTVEPTFLATLLATLNRRPEAAAVAGAVLRADQPQLLDAAWIRVHFGHGLVRRLGVNALPGRGFDVVRPIPVGMGSCLLLAADALERVGLLDESYFAYHEEVDWCTRARAAGYTIYYQPHARVWHAGSRSTRHEAVPTWPRRKRKVGPSLPNPIPLTWSPARTYLGARNAVRFVRRHGSFVQELRFWASSAYHVPLELLAVLLEREEEIMLGMWTWRRAIRLACLQDVETGAEWPRGIRGWVRAVRNARSELFDELPCDLARAHQAGATAQIEEQVRGLLDGLLDRPIPFERLRLR
jgi:GT2 family glycosyltransferase